MKRCFVMCLIVLGVSFVEAADFSWDGGGSDYSWTTSENWVGDVAPNGPSGTGRVYIQSGTSVMDNDVDITMTSHLYLGGAGSGKTGDASLTVNGGNLNSTGGYCIMGYNAADTGTLTVSSSSSLTFNGLLGIGVGWNGKGVLGINGGTVNANRLYTSFKSACPGGSSIDITNGGALNIEGYARLANYDDEPAAGTLRDSLTIDSGTFSVGSYLIAGAHGKIDISLSGTGSIDAGEYFKLGGASYSEAIMTMTGGTMDCAELIVGGDSGGTGYLDLSGGTVTTDILTMNTNGTLNISGGKLVLVGNILDITSYGNIVANGGEGVLNYAYDSVNDVTSITAIPEPATLVILGLGGLMLRSGKK